MLVRTVRSSKEPELVRVSAMVALNRLATDHNRAALFGHSHVVELALEVTQSDLSMIAVFLLHNISRSSELSEQMLADGRIVSLLSRSTSFMALANIAGAEESKSSLLVGYSKMGAIGEHRAGG
jgi:hypothetical protein